MNTTQLLQEADRCVKCGICLAACPTYPVMRHEGDSPRGRIALIQALASGTLTPSPTLSTHLHHCLHCLNCQQACPSEVRYQDIIDAGLALLGEPPRWRLRLLSEGSQWPWLPWFIRLLQRGGPRRLATRLTQGNWRRQLELWPESLPRPLAPRDEPGQGHQLFLGCISRLTDASAQRALVAICAALGLELSIPRGQTCCGALHRHQGDGVQADRYAEINARVFARAASIVCLSSGCGAELRAHFGAKAQDASDFVLRHWPDGLKLSPWPARVAIHTPCSLRNSLGGGQGVWELLHTIPDLQLEPLTPGYGCCGGAGLQLVEQADLADTLLEPLLAQIATLRPDLIVTSSTGCALGLRRGLARRGLNLPVLHPLELIARQWPSSTIAPKP